MLSMKNLACLLSLFVVTSCSYHNIEPAPAHPSVKLAPSSDPIVGVWYWTKTDFGWGGTATPASKGYDATLVLTSSFGYTEYKNMTITRSGKFSVSEESGYQYIAFDSGYKELLTQPSANELIIGTIAADGPMTYYQRAK